MPGVEHHQEKSNNGSPFDIQSYFLKIFQLCGYRNSSSYLGFSSRSLPSLVWTSRRVPWPKIGRSHRVV